MKQLKYDDYDVVMLPLLIMHNKNLAKLQTDNFLVGMLFEGRTGEAMIFQIFSDYEFCYVIFGRCTRIFQKL